MRMSYKRRRRAKNVKKRLTGSNMSKKFLVTVDESIYRALEKEGKKRGYGVSTLVRTVIIPEWILAQQQK